MYHLKYQLLPDYKNVNGQTVYRIKALKSFSDVTIGDLGGWIHSEDNLSQQGNCWVYNNAAVTKKAQIKDNVKIYDDVIVTDNADISGNVILRDYAIVKGNSNVTDNVRITGDALVDGNTFIFGNCEVADHAKIRGYVVAYGNCFIGGRTSLKGHIHVFGDACLNEEYQLDGYDYIFDNSDIDNLIEGNKPKHNHLHFDELGLYNEPLYFDKQLDGSIYVKTYNAEVSLEDYIQFIDTELIEREDYFIYKQAINLAKDYLK